MSQSIHSIKEKPNQIDEKRESAQLTAHSAHTFDIFRLNSKTCQSNPILASNSKNDRSIWNSVHNNMWMKNMNRNAVLLFSSAHSFPLFPHPLTLFWLFGSLHVTATAVLRCHIRYMILCQSINDNRSRVQLQDISFVFINNPSKFACFLETRTSCCTSARHWAPLFATVS